MSKSLFELIEDDATVEEIKAAIANGADVKEKDEGYKNTPLHKAAEGSWRADIVRALVEAGADVNAPNSNLYTPLHYAALHGVSDDESDEGVKALIEAGADVNARTFVQETPLHLALGDIDSCALGSLEIVRTLVEAGADVNAQTESGLTPMRILRIIENAYEDDHELIEPYIALLLEAGAENY